MNNPNKQSATGEASPERVFADNTRARQNTNKENALMLAKVGVAVFPSSGKTPLIPMFNRRDTEIAPEDREAAIAKYREDHDDKTPIHVGATTDPVVVKRMWRAFRDAVPSIACGPSGIVVFDADCKDEGPAKMAALWDEHGGLPKGALASPTKSGGKHFIFADPEHSFTNKAGALKKYYGTDVRGSGGQIIAPGSMLDDGRSYGTREDLFTFLRAYTVRTLSVAPSFLRELIGAAPEHTEGELVTPSKEREVIQALIDTDWPEFDDTFAPTRGKYDLDSLKRSTPEFAKLYDEPTSDHSTNRFLAARHVMREWPSMPVEDLAVFFEHWEGAGAFTGEKPKTGEYDLRQVAREWIKNQGLSKPSNGDAFGPVADDPEDVEYEKKLAEENEDAARAAARHGSLYLGSELVTRYRSPDWLVQNMLAPRTVGAISGASNVGKSFSVLDLCQHLPRGREWFGLNVERCGVLYAYGEGHLGIASRLRAWALRNDVAGGDIVVRDGIPNFAGNPVAAVKALKRAVKEANAMLVMTGTPPIKLLVLDTFAKATAGAEENSAKDMGPIMASLRSLADDLDVCVVIIHHTGKNSALGLRGSTAILGDVDFNIEILDSETGKKKRPVVSVPKGQLCMYVAKMRDAPKGTKLFFKLEPVVIGEDKWGADETSMVVRPITQASIAASMGAVEESDDAPVTADNLSEELERDANIRAEVKRNRLLEDIVGAMRTQRKGMGGQMQMKLQSLADLVPALQDLKARVGASNFVRRFKERVMLNDAEVDLSNGRLRLEESRKRGCSARLVFTPVAS